MSVYWFLISYVIISSFLSNLNKESLMNCCPSCCSPCKSIFCQKSSAILLHSTLSNFLPAGTMQKVCSVGRSHLCLILASATVLMFRCTMQKHRQERRANATWWIGNSEPLPRQKYGNGNLVAWVEGFKQVDSCEYLYLLFFFCWFWLLVFSNTAPSQFISSWFTPSLWGTYLTYFLIVQVCANDCQCMAIIICSTYWTWLCIFG